MLLAPIKQYDYEDDFPKPFWLKLWSVHRFSNVSTMPPKRTLEDVVSDSGGLILHKDLLLRWRAYRDEFPIRASGVPPVTHYRVRNHRTIHS